LKNNLFRYVPQNSAWIVVEILGEEGDLITVRTEWYGWNKEPFKVSRNSLEKIGRLDSPFVEAI
jgi:hypothetical protein